MPRLTKEAKLKMCQGCCSHYYNDNNPHGIKECWSFKEAKLVSRVRVGLWETPPWDESTVNVLNCYSEEGNNRSIYMELATVKESNRKCIESLARI